MKKPRYLTKSRFKLALDCPTKLYYTRKPKYENQSETDTFLQALAQGGFQVEELARMQYPDGIAIVGDDYNYNLVVARTKKLLEQENVVIFEPAFLMDGLFIRVDILVKRGINIQLIEVKAKSIRSQGHTSFIKNEKLTGGWDAYLYDIAFQKHVMQLAYPEWQISSSLQLVDKDAVCTVDGLNQCFKIVENSENRTGIEKKKGLTATDIGEPILCRISVDDEMNLIHKINPLKPELSFEETVNYFRDHYANDVKIFTEIGKHCGGCEFKSDTQNGNSKSGFHECWQEQTNLSIAEIDNPKVWDVWNFRRSAKLAEEGKLFMHELAEADVGVKPQAGKMSSTERRWIQIKKQVSGDSTPQVDLDNLRQELSSWKFPLNFIDFETTAVAIPFTAGRKPYEQLAFQFSHHIVYENGRVEHHNQYLNTEIGFFPNFEFIRALKTSLENNKGSILRYHNHENTIVNVIYNQLKVSEEKDKVELLEFIQSISHNTGSNSDTWAGNRDMIDLYKVVLNYYYNPSMGGSNSIKAVLPAVLNSSEFLKKKYSLALKEIGVSSLNFDSDYIYLKYEYGKVLSPYKLLPPIFKDWDKESLDAAITEIEGISDGGAALTAYGKLQFENVSLIEKQAIREGLLRYCELDTLAMVMIYECFRELSK
ncbi:DUF2779 domain-containing protein [Aequorivita marina]|uniref:DUF2779 domain-containing protein n=1 Tax=Aequorivita marina TaxID=3073654 RepID=UPI0028747D51|nr:DUF2779 domain-containing protein [Aequorivita sp. S2608]MDS1297328.1 DUF2779 domain-containing protein [Aequorivita sp. S2608]